MLLVGDTLQEEKNHIFGVGRWGGREWGLY